MHQALSSRWSRAAVVLVLAGVLAWPAASGAQTVSGFASAAQATVFGMTTALGHTGSLADEDDARGFSQLAGSIPSVLSAKALHAATISSIYGWDSGDSVASEASLANLGLTVAGNTISARFLMAEALAPVGDTPVGSATVTGLRVNGVSVWVSGEPNQTVSLPGATLVLNAVNSTASGITVTALKVTSWDGLTDVAVATAMAGVGSAASTTSSTSSTDSVLSTTESTLSNTTSTTGLPGLP